MTPLKIIIEREKKTRSIYIKKKQTGIPNTSTVNKVLIHAS